MQMAEPRRVLKYELQVTDEQTVDLPRGAELLHVAQQDPSDPLHLQLWALVDPDAPDEPRRFAVRGTGHLCEDFKQGRLEHIGTVLCPASGLVWHVFAAALASA